MRITGTSNLVSAPLCAASYTCFWDLQSFLHSSRIPPLSTTTRRKARRDRAKARRNWFLHKKGWINLAKPALRKIWKMLSQHHSKDYFFLTQINKAMNLNEEDPNDTYYPWKCSCGRINKKWATTCAICWGKWTDGTRHPTRPKNQEAHEWNAYTWDDWEDNASWASSRSTSRTSTKYRLDGDGQPGQQKPFKKGKGKGQGKGKKGPTKGLSQNKGSQVEHVSPFQQGESFAPWTPMDISQFGSISAPPVNPFASQMPATSSNEKQEFLDHLRKAYPDPNTMPEETKQFIAKTEQETGRMGIKSLHQATKHLGKVKKHLGEVADQRRAHRSLWMAHLANGIKLWEKQLEDYRKHQATLTELAGKARSEVTATSRIIQQLSSATAGGSQAPPPPQAEAEEAPEDQVDKEEEALRKQLQRILQNCASSLGLEFDPQKVVEIQDTEVAEDETQRQKRPRALEPFGPSSKQ